MLYFCKIAYLGTAFHGFQVQPGKRTVQGELCRAFSQTFGTEVSVTGCSRTDAGVHATGFCLTVSTENDSIPEDKIPIAVLPYMPPDITLLSAKAVPPSFHPRYDAKSKEYEYRILNRKIPDAFLCGRVWFLPRLIGEEGISLMRSSLSYLLGEHDFSSFMSEGSDVSSTVRNVFSASLEKTGDMLVFRIRADGFLYNMVRIIVGTLTEIGYGRFRPEDLPRIIDAKDRSCAGPTAPAEGLYLKSVYYE